MAEPTLAPWLWYSCGQRYVPLNGSFAFLLPKGFLMPSPPACTLGYSSSMQTLENPHCPRMWHHHELICNSNHRRTACFLSHVVDKSSLSWFSVTDKETVQEPAEYRAGSLSAETRYGPISICCLPGETPAIYSSGTADEEAVGHIVQGQDAHL